MISYVVQHVVHPVSKVLGLSPEDLSSTRSANPPARGTWTLGASGFCAGAATSGFRIWGYSWKGGETEAEPELVSCSETNAWDVHNNKCLVVCTIFV